MSKIFWDTNPFIYLIEKDPQYWRPTKNLRDKMLSRGDQLITSYMTVGEIQVKPLRMGRADEAALYKQVILQTALVVPFENDAADRYAVIREKTKVRGADAIQLACAAAIGVEIFITNDIELHKLRIPGIHFIIPIQAALQVI